MAESVQGLRGRLATTEWMFYTFDTLPLFICIATFAVFWPGRFIPSTDTFIDAEDKPLPLGSLQGYDGSQSRLAGHAH